MSDLVKRAKLMAEKAALDEKDRASRNRQRMPKAAAIFDEMTKLFGKLPYGSLKENGYHVTWGKPRARGRSV